MQLLTEEAGTYFSVELGKKIHFDKYKQSYQTIEEIVNELNEKEIKILAEPWLVYIRSMERTIEKLTKQVTDTESQINTQGQLIDKLANELKDLEQKNKKVLTTKK